MYRVTDMRVGKFLHATHLTCAALAALLFAGAGAAADTVPTGRLPGDVTPTHYQLNLRIDPRADEFSGRAVIRVTVRVPLRTIWLHGHGLEVAAVSVTSGSRSIPAHYAEVDRDFGVARVSTDADVPAGPATLSFSYRAPFQTSEQGLYRTRVGDDWYAFTQLESIDARRVFPGFDEPGFKTPFDIAIMTRATDEVVSNTPELRRVPGNGWVRHEFRTTRPLPTYLLACAVGPLDIVAAPPVAPNAVRPAALPLRIVATRGQGPRTAYAARETPKLIGRLEEYFGIPFPYPKLDLIASPASDGAMENAGAIIFGDALLLFDEHPTARQQAGFGAVAAHEIAHQWFGDLVTPAWWDDIWLNEAFAEWMGAKIASAWRPDLDIDAGQLRGTLAAMDTDALHAGRQIHQPIVSNAEIATTFDDITYQKGAGVLGMFESYLGEERFREGVRLHLRRHVDGTATAGEFFAAMAAGSGDAEVVEALRSFVDQAGVPLITVGSTADGGLLTLAQSRYQRLGPGFEGSSPELWKMPVCVETIGAAPPTRRCTLLSARRGTLELPGLAGAGTAVHPNAQGRGYYRFKLDPDLLQRLLRTAPRLPPREALVLADSIAAAFEAGGLAFADLLAAAEVLATHPDREAALFLGEKLLRLHDVMADAAERPALERRIVALYKPRLEALGFGLSSGGYGSDTGQQQLLRQSLLALVALGGRDPDLRRALVQAALRSLDHPAALDPGLRRTAWSVGVQEAGGGFARRLEALLVAARDPQLRVDAAHALGNAEDAKIAARVRALVLDPRLDITSVGNILFSQIRNPLTRAATWSWLAANR
ncbi:MAG: M1 family metallopeptidase, partial [Gammaproteobacteria bacterium]|nr:M1 family metallopeptidase [Gammaproteobacteria bacterium]